MLYPQGPTCARELFEWQLPTVQRLAGDVADPRSQEVDCPHRTMGLGQQERHGNTVVVTVPHPVPSVHYGIAM